MEIQLRWSSAGRHTMIWAPHWQYTQKHIIFGIQDRDDRNYIVRLESHTMQPCTHRRACIEMIMAYVCVHLIVLSSLSRFISVSIVVAIKCRSICPRLIFYVERAHTHAHAQTAPLSYIHPFLCAYYVLCTTSASLKLQDHTEANLTNASEQKKHPSFHSFIRSFIPALIWTHTHTHNFIWPFIRFNRLLCVSSQS